MAVVFFLSAAANSLASPPERRSLPVRFSGAVLLVMTLYAAVSSISADMVAVLSLALLPAVVYRVFSEMSHLPSEMILKSRAGPGKLSILRRIVDYPGSGYGYLYVILAYFAVAGAVPFISNKDLMKLLPLTAMVGVCGALQWAHLLRAGVDIKGKRSMSFLMSCVIVSLVNVVILVATVIVNETSRGGNYEAMMSWVPFVFIASCLVGGPISAGTPFAVTQFIITSMLCLWLALRQIGRLKQEEERLSVDHARIQAS